MKPGTIVLPIAGRSSRFPGTRPKWLLTAPTGELMLEHALRSVGEWREHRVVIGALREHLTALKGEEAIRRALGDGPEIVMFDDVTRGPAETVAQIISRAEVSGGIFIKDCDSWFDPPSVAFDNIVCVADLRKNPNVKNIPGKSFVQLNENELIDGILEKYVCSPFISVGGYGFKSAELFLESYSRVQRDMTDAEPFVSHVILESIRRGEVFRGVTVSSYKDVGTLEAWNEYREGSSLLLMDIDGVVFRNAGQYTTPLWDDEDVPLPENVERLKDLQANGAQIVFITSRPEKYRMKTEAALRAAGLSWHAAIFGVSHARRILVNDFAASNPYPSAVAVNVDRNSDDLKKFL